MMILHSVSHVQYIPMSDDICDCRTGMVTMNYSDVAEQAFKTGPRPLRKLASFSW